ncbi:class I SAM-dependent methyltransferase [Solibacillus sp. MA9]|uniref:Class I SAM-dependent methyltransferase n=1 Tax=Solibacillus palustris TaxID=2908203 RepID=A0ABS9UBK4_9BACL|nr:class I SAM-dependent methyltransferase [Solibacillus sp. MA9]MCH7321510.1 class I SAM-dependent methyltransferase [Solibacillus sp. MA9]
MLSNQGFNLWADEYDKTVQLSEENNLYPFAGYKEILNVIFNEVMQKRNSEILDIGFGTGVLTSKLYANGHQIDGVDFSSKMIAIAQSMMPNANLMEWDISMGLPPEILGKKYDAIISTYALHHLTDQEKIAFIAMLKPMLKEDGKIYIGDIAFETREKHNQCRQESIGYWDDDEFYFVHEEIRSLLKNECDFYPISHCGGVFIL